ncbi:YTH domain-containing protein ECT4-like [Typha latifolia]|uniref:YTH domain-containing protein ECT4-like n=1 Tax=Typha latifolia TaxID=4733 RepID=UPI003C2DDF0C
MATVAAAADQATDLLQKMSLDPKSKALDAPEVTKKPSGNQYGNAGAVSSTAVPSYERSVTPLLQEYMDANVCYLPSGYPPSTYYYGGYDGSANEWEDYSRYVNHEGVEMPSPGVYGEIHHGYGYAPYGPYPSPGSPIPTMLHDGQLYGPQNFQFPAPYYQPSTHSSAPYTPNQAALQQKGFTPAAADQAPISVEAAKMGSNGSINGNKNGKNGSAPLKESKQNSLPSSGSYTRGVLPGGPPPCYQDPRFGFDGIRSPVQWFNGPMFPDRQQRPTTNTVSSTVSRTSNSTQARNKNPRVPTHSVGLQNPRPISGVGSAAPGIVNRLYPSNQVFGHSGNLLRPCLGFGSNFYDSRLSGHWGALADSRYKPRGQGNGFYGYCNENLDGLSELNRGPRSGRSKNHKSFGSTIAISVKGQNPPAVGNIEDSNVDKDLYNRSDFVENHTDAKFFIIKSYSEDDIHKSIKYSVWASTPNGNKKLDSAYQEAKEKLGSCPVFLFFSVNTSGQFVGVAEMMGPVDFDKTLDYWQQDKWNGCFAVKWHILKDVPNNMLKHIILENNENKPVTNSRDTQEVKLEQGLQVLKIFKDHVCKTSILDDFSFYDTRQKIMQDRRVKQQQLQRKVLDGLSVADEKDIDGANGKSRSQKPLEAVTLLKKEPVQVGFGEQNLVEDNGIVAVTSAAPKDAKPTTEKRAVANDAANA